MRANIAARCGSVTAAVGTKIPLSFIKAASARSSQAAQLQVRGPAIERRPLLFAIVPTHEIQTRRVPDGPISSGGGQQRVGLVQTQEQIRIRARRSSVQER